MVPLNTRRHSTALRDRLYALADASGSHDYDWDDLELECPAEEDSGRVFRAAKPTV